MLDTEQHGFRPRKSTITAGIEFIQAIIDSVDKGEKIIGMFLDLSRAFDSVSHSKLIDTLSKLVIAGKELNWFKSYLSQRLQFVEIEHCTSDPSSKFNYRYKVASQMQTIRHGVPQGSVLGPLLFLL